MSGQGSGGNVIAAICNIFIVGLGQLVQGRILAALVFFLITYAFYGMAVGLFLIFFYPIGFIFQIWAIIDAARYRG